MNHIKRLEINDYCQLTKDMWVVPEQYLAMARLEGELRLLAGIYYEPGDTYEIKVGGMPYSKGDAKEALESVRRLMREVELSGVPGKD